MIGDALITAIQIIGTIAFAVSGSLVAIGSGLDLFGVTVVGCFTAVGGGMIRDLLIGNIPPQVFLNPKMLLLAFIASVIVFVISYINAKNFNGLRRKIDGINIVFDALGLAAFSVTGTQVAVMSNFSSNAFLCITLGVLTGVGGGIIRDVLVNEKPYVLTKHIYAVASIIGSSIYYFVYTYTDYKIVGTVVAMVSTILIRLLAAKFRWRLPKIKFSD